MSIVIEHEKRRKQILQKALDVFIEEGFEDASCQKIADRCKITRTTLYLYFRNRQEIFNFSIKQFMAEMERNILEIREDPSLSCSLKLKKTLFLILKRLEENRRLLSVILNYLLIKDRAKGSKTPISMRPARSAGREGFPPDIRVRRRTIRLRHILSAMLIAGIKAGELKKINVGTANDLFFCLIESAIFHLTVLKRESTQDLREAAELAVKSISAEA